MFNNNAKDLERQDLEQKDNKDSHYTTNYSGSHHNLQPLSGKDFKELYKFEAHPNKHFYRQLKDLGFDKHGWAVIKHKNNSLYAFDYWKGSLHKLKANGEVVFDENGKKIKDTREKWEDNTLVLYWGNSWEDGISHLNYLSKSGSLFLIPNHLNIKEGEPTSVGKRNVIACPAIFVESDDKTLEEQWDQIAKISYELGFPPSFLPFSGSRSNQPFWVFKEPIDVETWQRLQYKVICKFESDVTVSNPNREMRLAGFIRSDTGNLQRIQIVTEARYTPEEVEEKLDSQGDFPYGMDYNRFKQYRREGKKALSDPNIRDYKPRTTSRLTNSSNTSSNTPSKPSETPLNFSTSCPELTDRDCEIPPLWQFLPFEQREMLKGVPLNRNDNGHKLAINLVSTVNALVKLGIQFKGDAHEYFMDFCRNCPQEDWEENEWDQIWGQAYRNAGDPSVPMEELRRRANTLREFYQKKNPLTDKELRAKLSKFSPDKVIHKRYFETSDIEEAIKNISILLLMGLQSVGKSQSVNEIGKQFIANGKAFITITHRRFLSMMMGEKAGIPFQDEKGAFHSRIGFSCVVNSIDKIDLDSQMLEGACLYMDEIDQVLDAMLNDSTMKNKRLILLERLSKIIAKVVSTGGLLVCASADVADYIKDFMEKICNAQLGYNPSIYRLQNTFNPIKDGENQIEGRYRTTFLNDEVMDEDGVRIWGIMEQKIKQGEKLIIHSSSQKPNSRLGTLNLEAFLKRRFPNIKILRYDSQTNQDPDHPAYGLGGKLHKDKTFLDQYDVVIISPVGETGISIDDPNRHFDAVLAFFGSGNQDARAVLQTILRLRTDVPRFIWVIKQTNKKVGSGALSPNKLISDMTDHSKDLLEVLWKLKIVENPSELVFNNNRTFYDAWSYSACLKNNDFKDYRESILEALKERGFPIQEMKEMRLEGIGFEDFDIEAKSKEITANREETLDKYCRDVVETPEPDPQKYEGLKKANQLTPEQQLEKEKGYICTAMGVEPTVAVVNRKQKDRQWIQALKLRYLLTIGERHFSEKERKSWKALSRATGEVFAPEAIKKTYALEAEAMKKYGILQFIESIEEEDSPIFTPEYIDEWAEKVRENKKEVKQLLGISTMRKATKEELKEDEERKFVPVESTTILSRFLYKLDLRLGSNQKTKDQEKYREYFIKKASKKKYEDLIEYTDEVLEGWLKKDNEKKNYWAEFPQAIDITKEFLRERGTIGEQILRDKIAFFNDPEISIEAKEEEVKKMEEERQELIQSEIEGTIIYEGEEVLMLEEEEGSCPRGLLTLDLAPFVSNLSDYGYVPDSEAVPVPKSDKGQAHRLTKNFLKERGLEGKQMLKEAIAFFNNPEIPFDAKKEEIERMEMEDKEIDKKEREERKSLPRKVLFLDVVPFITDLNPLTPLTPLVLKDYFEMLPHSLGQKGSGNYLCPLIITRTQTPIRCSIAPS